MLHQRFLNFFENRSYLFFFFLFLSSFIFRAPTLFNDFYASDELAAIIQAKEYLAGDIPGIDFDESKKPLYHLIFKASYSLSDEYGWVYVHIITILIVFLTSIFIYLTAREISNHKSGILAAFLYSILISSFNAEFMATNGEIVYNLPLAAGFYFFIKYIKKGPRSLLYLIFSLIMCYMAYQVKFQGIILAVFFGIFFIIYLPYYSGKNLKRLLKYCAFFLLFIIFAAAADYYFFKFFAEKIIFNLYAKLIYAQDPGRGFTALHFIGRFVYRQGIFSLWHMILWLPAAFFIYGFIKGKFKFQSIEESSAALFFIITYAGVFAAGARLYYHYFMASYPALCVISSIAIMDNRFIRPEFIKKKSALLILIPGLFFLSWNTKDAVIRNFFPDGFYNEGSFLFWTRAVLMGTYNNYLLPGPVYMDAASEINRMTDKGDRIFVWGHGPDIYYFSKRRMGNYTLWPKIGIYLVEELYNRGDEKSFQMAMNIEESFINVMEKKKPRAFIDTSSSKGIRIFQTKVIDQSHFRVSPAVTKKFYPYILKNYELAKEVNNIKIYLKKENK